MTELIFPLSAVILTYMLVVPLFSLIVAAGLRVFVDEAHPLKLGRASVFFAIVAPVVLPVAIVLGAAMHRVDGHHALGVCLSHFYRPEACHEAWILGLLVVTPLVLAGGLLHRRSSPWGCRDPQLSEYAGTPVYLVDEPLVCTRGLFAPWIEIGRPIVEALPDSSIHAILRHEREHVRSLDPLFLFAGRVTLSVNPARFVLTSWFNRWKLGREIYCDLKTVDSTHDRFDFAEALVDVARRSRSAPPLSVGLTEATAALRVRIAVLVDDIHPGLRANAPSGRALAGLKLGIVIAAVVAGYVAHLPIVEIVHFHSENLILN